jgi:U3 small nucleolar RNA-associated protein 21
VGRSLLFEPYRALGYYASAIPFSLYKSDQDVLLASSVGDNAFYVYNTAKLSLVFMSRFIEERITAIEAAADGHIFTALSNQKIVKWNKMNKVLEYEGHTKPIVKFILSTDFLFSLAEEGEFIIFNIKTGQIVKRRKFETSFTVMMHPTTYINKLLFAGGSKVELWNVIEDTKIYDFKSTIEQGASVTVVVQSPVLHTVALGHTDGTISLVNLQADEVLFQFKQTEGAVRSLSFSSDTTLGVSLLASATGPSITLWDLNRRKVHSVV